MLARLKSRIKGRSVAPASALVPPEAVDLGKYPGLEERLEVGEFESACSLMQQLDPQLTADDLARIQLQLRHEAFLMASAKPAPEVVWPPETHLTIGEPGCLPEITSDQLDREALVAGVRTRGALIVRDFFPLDAAEELCRMIDNSMSAYGEDSARVDPDWNTPLRDVSGEILGAAAFRAFNFVAAGLPVADAPTAAKFVLAEFERLGLPDLVSSYLGEQPALSLEKWTMRRVPPDTGSSWHQDGAFLGTDKRTLNMWIALSDCGESASGLDIVAHRFDHIVTTGTPGAFFDWDVSPTVVEEERGQDPIVSPVFKAGDAVFFDQFLLHKTGTKPNLSDDRYALETWFFTPSSFPSHYAGLLL